MKKILSLILILAMAFTFAGFGTKSDRGSQTAAVEATPAPAEAPAVPAETGEELTATGYIYETNYGDTLFFLAVRNNTDRAVQVSGNALAKDAQGNSIGAGNLSIDVLGPGEESIDYAYFSNVTGVDTVAYQLVTKESSYYFPVLSDLSVESYQNDENVTLAVTNNGDKGAQFVEAYVLFLDAEGNVLRYASRYITDVDSEIKPGDTLYGQLDSYGSFDRAVVYLTGRSDGKPDHASSSFDNAALSVREFRYENGYGDTMLFLAITNNSDEEVEVYGNAAARDASGWILGAASFSTDVIGPGQESIAYFYLDDVSNPDRIDYRIEGDTDIYYTDVLADLDGEASVNGSNVVVSLTNTGSKPAKFVAVYALFFDEDGNMVGYDYNYVTDNDYEIKPGATLSTQLNTYNSFDYVELFATGRADKD